MDATDDPYVLCIDDLDDLCLIYIFTYLPIPDRLRIERVCKRWQTLVQVSWKRMDTLNWDLDFHLDNEGRTKADNKALQKVLELCGQFLKRIDFTHILSTPDILSNIHTYCPKLEIINVGSYSGPLIINSIAKNFTELKSFTACNQDLKPANFDFLFENENRDEGEDENRIFDILAQLFDRNRKLSTLSLVSCHLSAESFSHLNHDSIETFILAGDNIDLYEFLVHDIKKFKNLRQLDLDLQIENVSHLNLLNKFFKAANSKTVKCLRLTLSIDESISSETHHFYIDHFSNLEVLKIYAHKFLDDKILLSIAQNCTKLKKIKLYGGDNITEVGLTYINDLLNIENLDLFQVKISDKALSNMKSLKVLKCALNPIIKNEGLITLIETSQNIKAIELNVCSGINLEGLIDSMKRSLGDILEIKTSESIGNGMIYNTVRKVGNRISKKIRTICCETLMKITKICNNDCTICCSQEEIYYIE